MKVALVYDRVNKWGGAERVLLALHDLFPDAPLYTSVYDKKKASWAKVFTVNTSFLQNLPWASSNHEYFPYLMPLAFEQFTFDEYDLVISVTSEAAKGIITKPSTKHICYCLTPTRYLWSGYNHYFPNKFMKIAGYPVVSYLRKWDLIASQRPDVFVTLSKEVQGRVKKYYGRNSELIYPPLTLNPRPFRQLADRISDFQQGDYFLIVSRFVQYKRIDLAISVCNELGLPLKIVGSGREEKKLKAIAGPTIEFTGHVSDEKVVEYYKGCKAFLFPGLEDFGLTIIEAAYFGKPVIAFRGGGAAETIIECKTGYFFNKQTAESLRETLKKIETYTFDPKDCREQAGKFSLKKFETNFLRLVNSVI